VVIGGGDTGADCVGTCRRQGAKSIHQLEILPCPPQDRPADNPWPTWPRIERSDYSHREVAASLGHDPREYAIQVKHFLGNSRGEVQGVRTTRVRWIEEGSGGFRPEEIEGSEQTFEADLVLLAMGFLGPEATLIEQLRLRTDERSNVGAAYGSYQTSAAGVFAAGDMRRGQSLVVWAIHEGREAAGRIDRYLAGDF